LRVARFIATAGFVMADRHVVLLLGLVAALLAVAALAAGGGVPGADRPAYVQRVALPGPGMIALPEVEGAPGARPLVVIDPGHGGFDPGAVAPGVVEKELTLALARAIREELVERGTVRVALTRDDDRFLSLGERSELARRLGADLFLSLHADSAGDAEEVVGASIYTLSASASDRAAAAYARRENEADRVNGVPIGGEANTVRSILVDLSRRRSQEEAVRFARLVEREGTGALTFRDPALRSAAFIVLRSPDVPSVLFEAGYISNADEARSMVSPAGRAALANVVADAIEMFFEQADRAPAL
jgi:N-acetylmuramoyl-L-alanine amidase